MLLKARGPRGRSEAGSPTGEAEIVLLLLLLESEGAGDGVDGGLGMALSSVSSPRMLWMEKDFALEANGVEGAEVDEEAAGGTENGGDGMA
jgi:hypothetical protein